MKTTLDLPDGRFLALAQQLGSQLVTEDAKLRAARQRSRGRWRTHGQTCDA